MAQVTFGGTTAEMDLESITDRMQVRESLQSGDVPAAIEKIEQLHPTVLQTSI